MWFDCNTGTERSMGFIENPFAADYTNYGIFEMPETSNNERRLWTVHGVWVILFKAALAGVPLILPWMVWVTSHVYRTKNWMDQGPRYTQVHANTLEMRMTALVDSKLAVLSSQIKDDLATIKLQLAKMPEQLPPKWWEDWVRERVKEHDERIKQLEQKNGATQ